MTTQARVKHRPTNFVAMPTGRAIDVRKLTPDVVAALTHSECQVIIRILTHEVAQIAKKIKNATESGNEIKTGGLIVARGVINTRIEYVTNRMKATA